MYFPKAIRTIANKYGNLSVSMQSQLAVRQLFSHSAINARILPINVGAIDTRFVWPLVTVKGVNCDRQKCREFSRTRKSDHFYSVLEVTPQATQAQIKHAFYRLSKLYHPDINKEPDAKVKYMEIVEAYETLGNKRHRRAYDSGVQNPEHVHESNPEDLRTYRPEGGFKKRNEAPPTGRSKIYNYDEFYRMHYGKTFNRAQDIKNSKNKKDEHEIKMTSEDDYRNVVVIGLLIAFLASIVMKKY